MSGRLLESYVFPASFAQQRMWFLCQMNPGAHRAYRMSGAFDVDGEIDPATLRAAVEILVERHEILRTRFVLLDEGDAEYAGELCQVIEPSGTVPVEESTVPAERVADALAYEPSFALDRLPLMRLRLITDDAGRQVLGLVAHHIMCDAWSLAVFLDELATVYRAVSEGREPDLPELAVQYADYSEWQRERVEELDADLAYWVDQLAGTPPLDLPVDRQRPDRQSFRGGRVDLHLPATLARRVEDLAAGTRATPFMVLLSALQAVLARRSGQADFAVGTPVGGRGMPEVDRGIGLYVNTVALRADLSGEPTYRDLIRRVRGTCLDGFARQEVPFERIVQRVVPDRDLRRSPLFGVFFALQNMPSPAVELPGARLVAREVPRTTAMFDLRFTLRPDGDELTGWLEYSADLFDEATARDLATEWLDVVEEMLDDPDTPVEFDRVDLVTPTREPAPPVDGMAPTAPRTPLETELAAIFRRVLGKEELDVRTSFFELGGTSFLAVRAMRQVRRTLRVNLPVETIFSLTSVAQLAHAIESPENMAVTPDSEGIRDDVDAMWRQEKHTTEPREEDHHE